jgi:hypothetical protein
MNKIGKATDLAKELKSKGYPVKRKKGKLNEADMKNADDFRKKKEDEAKKKADDDKHASRRSAASGSGDMNEKNQNRNPEWKKQNKNSDEDELGNKSSVDKINKERSKKWHDANKSVSTKNQANKDVENTSRNTRYAADAKMRHDRRHSVKEEVEDLFNF